MRPLTSLGRFDIISTIKLPQRGFLVRNMTNNLFKYLAITSVFASFIFLKIGVMKGEADYILYPAVIQSQIIGGIELVNKTPIAMKNIRPTVTITAYSSRVQETDSTPFITASGYRVRDGIVAANWLPFGTKVKIPALFGDKIFVVEDRMHRRNSEKLDIWFSETSDAFKFGVRRANVEIL